MDPVTATKGAFAARANNSMSETTSTRFLRAFASSGWLSEIPGEAMGRSTVIVDSREACLAEAGDLVMAMGEGHLDSEAEPAEIGEVLAGSRPGRSGDAELTLFKSVGNAVQDLAVAGLVLNEARRLELGTEVEL